MLVPTVPYLLHSTLLIPSSVGDPEHLLKLFLQRLHMFGQGGSTGTGFLSVLTLTKLQEERGGEGGGRKTFQGKIRNRQRVRRLKT